MANLKEFRALLDDIEAKYGPNVEIMPHGPESVSQDNAKRRKWFSPDAPAFYSGFGPAANYIAGTIQLRDEKKLMCIFLHGLPIQEQDGPFGYPVFTSQLPLFWKPTAPGRMLPP
jgi:hypothetical protein